MNATQAKQITDRTNHRGWWWVIELIKEAANKGKAQAVISNDKIDNEDKALLETMGYKVTTGKQDTFIDWSNPK